MKNNLFVIIAFIVCCTSCSKKNYVTKTAVISPHQNHTTIVSMPTDTVYHKTIKAPTYIDYEIKPEVYYQNSYNELKDMLENKQSLNFKRAVFVTENAYLNNQVDYNLYCKYIESLSAIALQWSKTNKLNDYKLEDSTNLMLNGAIFHTLTDTVFDKQHNIVNLPYVYDFEDAYGSENFTQQFVTKLLSTHKGQCHSLPYLYKIIAEELKAKVWLSFTPNHIYLRNRCKKTGWYNTELTSASFPSEAWVMTSSHVTINSIVSGIYMDTLSLKQSVATCVKDLADGYRRKVKNHDAQFVLNCCNLALSCYPNYASALYTKAETLKNIYESYIKVHGLNAPQQAEHKDYLENLTNEINKTYNSLAQLDFRMVPKSKVSDSLKTLVDNKESYQDSKIINTFKTDKK